MLSTYYSWYAKKISKTVANNTSELVYLISLCPYVARVSNEKKSILTDFFPSCFMLQGIPKYFLRVLQSLIFIYMAELPSIYAYKLRNTRVLYGRSNNNLFPYLVYIYIYSRSIGELNPQQK